LRYNRYLDSKKFTENQVIPLVNELARKAGENRFERQEWIKLADRMKNCGQYTYWIQCSACGSREFQGFTSCKVRYCVACARKKALLWVARLMPVVSEHISQGGNVALITFTYRNQENLAEMIQIMQTAWRSFYNDSSTAKIFKERFMGGIRSMEVKRGAGSGLWHVHFHCLVLTPAEWQRDWPWILEKWKQVTDGNGSVDVRGIRKKQGIVKAVIETVKYICKPGDIKNADDFRTVYWALKGKRQINTWGKLRGLAKKIELEMDQSFEEKKLTEFICQKCGCKEGIIVKLLESLGKVA
jgi:hypothetical protein